MDGTFELELETLSSCMDGKNNINFTLEKFQVSFTVHKTRAVYLKANSTQEQVKMAPVQYVLNFSYHIDLVETGPRWEPACYCI